MSQPSVSGIHHVTVICGDAQTNLDFYTGVLGLRLVKLTVNFDDPTAYHLYYGDGAGTPGSILTYFPYPGGRRYRPGNGMFSRTDLAVAPDSLGFWLDRLHGHGVEAGAFQTEFGEEAIGFEDPDGMFLALVASDAPEGVAWEGMPIEPERAIRRVHAVRLASGTGSSAAFLEGRLGFRLVAEEGGVARYETGTGGSGSRIDLTDLGHEGHGGHGGTHHVALATADDEAQAAWRESLVGAGAHVSPIMNRDYFHSIYFREPGGSLYEIATLPPGFTLDESFEQFGTALQLPEMYRHHRQRILESVPRLKLPNGEVIGG